MNPAKSAAASVLDALWPEDAPATAEATLRVLLSRLRRALPGSLEGRSLIRLALPDDAWVDLEAAMEAVHRAESAVARRDWPEAYWAARVAQTVTGRTFLPGEDAPWIEEIRRSLEDVRMRTLECLAEAALEVGGTEVATSERTARTLTKEAPYREGAYRLLMRSLAARGEIADVVRLYEELRSRLRDDLGVVPAAATRDLYRTLVHAGADDGRVEPEVRSRTQ